MVACTNSCGAHCALRMSVCVVFFSSGYLSQCIFRIYFMLFVVVAHNHRRASRRHCDVWVLKTTKLRQQQMVITNACRPIWHLENAIFFHSLFHPSPTVWNLHCKINRWCIACNITSCYACCIPYVLYSDCIIHSSPSPMHLQRRKN